ncbi:MAG: bifunctional diaminohydroxyphosphoribosylaminopyrimidine deaminase/5-amino-6-(5-phosphoribosylamino)uracil reductase RibD [Acidimicrobiia bacterium]
MTRRVKDNLFRTHRVDEMMRRAIGLTETTAPHPNPRVGAIVVNPAGEVVAERAHLRAGGAHAEAAALADAGPAGRGSTLIVTLEPCAHHGRTPPCAEAVIQAGVERVFVGALDPDPRVAGRGVAMLRDAGIEVETGIEEAAVVANDPAYFHHRATGLPLVTLKIAATLDGQSAAADRTSQWITGPEARRDAHRLRSTHDAVLVGSGTVIADDPRLDVRLDGYSGPQPRPIVIAGRRTIGQEAAVLQRRPIVFVGAGDVSPSADGAKVVPMAGGNGVDLVGAVRYLGSDGVLSVLIEGGPRIAGSALSAGIVDQLVLYYGARLAGGIGLPAIAGTFATIDDTLDVSITKITTIGPDFRVDAIIERGT